MGMGIDRFESRQRTPQAFAPERYIELRRFWPRYTRADAIIRRRGSSQANQEPLPRGNMLQAETKWIFVWPGVKSKYILLRFEDCIAERLQNSVSPSLLASGYVTTVSPPGKNASPAGDWRGGRRGARSPVRKNTPTSRTSVLRPDRSD